MNNEMMVVALGLASAAVWGSGDFFGGMATKIVRPQRVVFWGQLVGAGVLLALVLARREQTPPLADAALSGVAGLMGAIGLLALYRALSTGKMGVVAPLSAVVSAVLPVIFGALTLGAPSITTRAGFGMALVAVALIAYHRATPDQARLPNNFGLAIVSGLGFGAFFICIAQVSGQAVFFPILLARCASLAAFAILNFFAPGQRANFAPPSPRGLFALIAANGIADALGNVLYVAATQFGRIDIAAVASSLYPASTVILAMIFLKERLNITQTLGVALALAAIALISMK